MTNSNLCQPPNNSAQRWIVLIAVAQSLLLLYAHTAIDENHWLSATPFRLTTWYTLTLTVPTALMLLITGQRVALSIAFATGMTVLLGLQAALAGNNCDPTLSVDCGNVLFPFGLSITVICFLALPFLQAWQHQGRANSNYLLLFEYAWHNALSLVLAAAFLGLFWVLLALWAGLFSLLDIQFFADLFSEKVFFYPISGLVVGFGLAIARTRIELLANIRENSLFWIFKSLTPLLAIITLLFLVAVALSGIDALWNTGTAGDLLAWLAITIVVFINAVFLNGEASSPYPKAIRWLVNFALLSLPIIAGLGLWAISLRVEQYGWTVARLWALCVMLILLLYGIGYAIAVLRSIAQNEQPWLSSIKPHNSLMALVIIAALCLINLGLPSFHQTTINSQLERLKADEVSWQEFDFKYLRFETGMRGYQAVADFLANPSVELSEHGQLYIQQILNANSRWENETSPYSREALIAGISLRDGETPPDELFDFLIDQYHNFARCREADIRCAIVEVALRRDQTSSWLFMLHGEYDQDWRVYEVRNGAWAQIAQLGNYGDRSLSAFEKIFNGEYDIIEPTWLDIQVDGKRFSIHD